MLTRKQVYDLIDVEREYQDYNYQPESVTSSGLTRRQRDLEVAPGLTMLSAYVRKAEDAWISEKGTATKSLQQIGKIAAIAVRILERAGDSEVLLKKGLR
jgi:hypothetical protein